MIDFGPVKQILGRARETLCRVVIALDERRDGVPEDDDRVGKLALELGVELHDYPKSDQRHPLMTVSKAAAIVTAVHVAPVLSFCAGSTGLQAVLQRRVVEETGDELDVEPVPWRWMAGDGN